MNEQEFIREYAATYNTSLKEARVCVESVHALYRKKLYMDGEDITINKLWGLKHKTIKPRRIKHPSTGEYKVLESKDVIRFVQSESPF